MNELHDLFAADAPEPRRPRTPEQNANTDPASTFTPSTSSTSIFPARHSLDFSTKLRHAHLTYLESIGKLAPHEKRALLDAPAFAHSQRFCVVEPELREAACGDNQMSGSTARPPAQKRRKKNKNSGLACAALGAEILVLNKPFDVRVDLPNLEKRTGAPSASVDKSDSGDSKERACPSSANEAVLNSKNLHESSRKYALEATVGGLSGCKYLDSLDGRAEKVESLEEVSFAGEVDRIYMDVPRVVTVSDSSVKFDIGTTESLTDGIVWNPWISKAASMKVR